MSDTLDDWYVMRARAQAADLRNRRLPAEAPAAVPTCDCGDVLTVADRGSFCRQCILAMRLDGTR